MNENEKFRFTGESFGADCPDNWEDIVAALNDIVERDNIVDKDEAEALWDKWCCHGLDGVPDPIFNKETETPERSTTIKYRIHSVTANIYYDDLYDTEEEARETVEWYEAVDRRENESGEPDEYEIIEVE